MLKAWMYSMLTNLSSYNQLGSWLVDGLRQYSPHNFSPVSNHQLYFYLYFHRCFVSVFAPVFVFSLATSWRRCQYFLPQLQSEADSFWRLITKLWFGFVSDYLRFANPSRNTFWQNFSPQRRLESAFSSHHQLSSEGDNSRSPPVAWRRREQSTATKCYHRGIEVNGLWQIVFLASKGCVRKRLTGGRHCLLDKSASL